MTDCSPRIAFDFHPRLPIVTTCDAPETSSDALLATAPFDPSPTAIARSSAVQERMRPEPLAVVAIACLVGCSRDAPPSAPCPSVVVPSPGVPPFTSISSTDLPAHGSVTWRVNIIGFGTEELKSFELGSKRAADVPLPNGIGWYCRVGPVAVVPAPGGVAVSRPVRCSSDHWRTSAGDDGAVWPGEAPLPANIALYDGDKHVGTVIVLPCTPKSPCPAAPEMP